MYSLVGHHRRATCVRYNGNKLITCEDLFIREWDLKTLELVDSFACISPTIFLGIHGDRLIVSSKDAVRVYDSHSKEFLFSLPEDFSFVTCLKFDHRRIVCGAWDGYIKIHAAPNGALLKTLVGHHNPIYCLDTSTGAIATGSSDKTVKLWLWDTSDCLRVLKGHTKTVNTLQLCSKTQLVVSGSKDKLVKLWDLRAPSCIKTLSEHSDSVTCLQFNSTTLVTGCKDGFVRVWDLRSERLLQKHHAHAQGVNSLQFDSHKIVSGGEDNLVKLWQFC